MSAADRTPPDDALTEPALRGVDPDGMYDHVRGFADQWRRARERVADISIDLSEDAVDHVVLVGMGGSAISGDLLSALIREKAAVPVTVNRSYDLPGFVGERTLVIGSSYSGHTEETVSAFQEGIARGATCYGVTSGGHLQHICEQEGLGFHRLPEGYPPRAALGYSLAAVLKIVEEAGIYRVPDRAWEESTRVLEEMTEELSDLSGNRAMEIARALRNRLPIVYSGSTLTEPVNVRWRCQLQENAETLAYGNAYPEFNHNEIMGWADSDWLLPRLAVITLRDGADHPRVQKRIEILGELLGDRAGYWVELESRGEHPLTRILSLIHLGDWVSLYLAVLNGTDPSTVSLIDELKRRLA